MICGSLLEVDLENSSFASLLVVVKYLDGRHSHLPPPTRRRIKVEVERRKQVYAQGQAIAA